MREHLTGWRVKVTSRDSKPRREGSIPSQPARRVMPGVMGRSSNRKTLPSQRRDRGAIPRRSTHRLYASSREHRPTAGLQSSKLRMRVQLPLLAPLHVRSSSRFSGEVRRLQHGGRGFDSLSALSPGARRAGGPGLSDKEFALRSIRRCSTKCGAGSLGTAPV